MGLLNNQLMRGACNRSYQRLAAEFGPGPASMILAVALAHACYPKARYGDNGFQDEVVRSVRAFSPRCKADKACKFVEQWLDLETLSTEAVFRLVWGLTPDEFIYLWSEESDREEENRSEHVNKPAIRSEIISVDVLTNDVERGEIKRNSRKSTSEFAASAILVALSALAVVGLILCATEFIGSIGGPGDIGESSTSDRRQPANSKLRTWKDNTGNFETEAVLVGIREDQVRLQKSNGTRIWVPLRRLSNDDREWVQRAVAKDSGLVFADQTDVAEDAMFALATREAVASIMRHVDRPFEANFGKPLIQINPDDPTIACVCVQCTHQESGLWVRRVFLVVFENLRAPERAEVRDDLKCLLVNSEGKVLERDIAFWRELPIETQRYSGALNTDGPPIIVQTMLSLNELIPTESR